MGMLDGGEPQPAAGELGDQPFGERRLAGVLPAADAEDRGAHGCLAAGDAHVAGDRRPAAGAVDDEVVAASACGAIASSIAAATRSLPSEARSGVRRSAASSWPRQMIERAGAGQPHPVAALAEIVGERGDEAQPAAGLGHLDIAGRAAGA